MNAPNQPQIAALKCPQCGAALPPSTTGSAICQYCGSSLIWNPQSASTEGTTTVIRGIRLKMFTCVDSAGTGLEVFRMLMPVGWETRGGCQWLLDNPSMPAVVAFQMWNPQGAEMFEILPNINLVWNSSPMAQAMQPVGSRYFGAEVRPPMSIRDALRQIIIPRYRRGVQNLCILREEPQPNLPTVARSEAPMSGGSAEGGRVRITYSWQGYSLEEEIYGIVEIFRTFIPSMFGPAELWIWFIDFLFAFRAAQGRLDATANLFTTMVQSFQLNPHWYAAFKSVAQYLSQQQVQQIRHIGQIGQIIAQTGREIREQNLQHWYSIQERYDRIATEQSRAIRGVDAFLDPHRQEVVELPTGYGHAWANNLGEYILTEDPTFNPNLYSNLHWEQMEQHREI